MRVGFERERERALKICGCEFWELRERHGGWLVTAELDVGIQSSPAEYWRLP